MHATVKQVWRVIRTTARGFSDDELMTRAAALAFYSALSFAPLLVLLLWVVASLRPEWQAQLVDGLTGLVGPRASEGVRLVIENAKQRPSVGSLAGVSARELDSRSMTYSAGVTLDLPVDRVSERNAYRRALVSFQQSTRALEETNDRVTADVRSAIRAIRSAQVQTEIALQAIRSAERQIELSYELLKTGDANARGLQAH